MPETAATSDEAIAVIRGLGFAFNEAGELRKIDASTGEPGDEPFQFNISDDHAKNAANYEKLANQLPQIVYGLLEKNGLQRTYLPFDTPIERSTFIFTQPKPISKSKKLLVLINGSGYVLAGQWARKLIINNSMDHGTQLPYIRRAQNLGYDILVTNTNDNGRLINEKLKPIKGLEDPVSHATYVFENVIIPSNPEGVAIVAHSYGGSLARILSEKFTDFFQRKVFAIALTDAMIGYPPSKCADYFVDVTCNWIASRTPLDTNLTEGDREKNFLRVSAGHHEHEWTSYTAVDSVFKYLEEKHEKHLQKESTQ